MLLNEGSGWVFSHLNLKEWAIYTLRDADSNAAPLRNECIFDNYNIQMYYGITDVVHAVCSSRKAPVF